MVDPRILDYIDARQNTNAYDLMKDRLSLIITDRLQDKRMELAASIFNREIDEEAEDLQEKRSVGRINSSIPGVSMYGMSAPFGRNVQRYLSPKSFMTRLAYKYGFRHSHTKHVEGGSKKHTFSHPNGSQLSIHSGGASGTYWAHHSKSGSRWSHLGSGNTHSGLSKHFKKSFKLKPQRFHEELEVIKE